MNASTKKSRNVYDRQRTVQRICELMSQGQSLLAICKRADFPALDTVKLWQENDPTIRQAIAEARTFGRQVIASQRPADRRVTKPKQHVKRKGPGPHGTSPYPRRFTLERIVELMLLGNTLRQICCMPCMPTFDLVMKWQQQDPEVKRVIAEARAYGAHALAEQTLDIADELLDPTSASDDERSIDEPSDRRAPSMVDVAVAKLRINTRMRLAGAWAPETYARNANERKDNNNLTVVIDFAAMGVSSDDGIPARREIVYARDAGFVETSIDTSPHALPNPGLPSADDEQDV